MDGAPDELIVGVDEAGRGAWVGPLVVGAIAVRTSRLADLVGAGARDSKQLAPSARAAVYDRLGAIGTCRSIALAPGVIDRSVDRGQLNRLEAEAFARLIRRLRPHTAYVDACDANAGRFGRTVAALARCDSRIIARHAADRDVPIVGAASIVAKVRRDRAIARLAERLGQSVGSGYPSDPRTIAFVRASVPDGGSTPRWLRRSWATTKRVIPARPALTLDRFGP